MHAGDAAPDDQLAHEVVQHAGDLEVGGGRRAATQIVSTRPFGATELGFGATEQHDGVAVVEHRARRHRGQLVDQADDADHRRGVDVAPARLVVEAHVAADDGDAERAARVAHAVDDLGELPHHLGMLRVAEVEAVDQRLGRRTHAREVAGRLDHREARAGVAGRARRSGPCRRW